MSTESAPTISTGKKGTASLLAPFGNFFGVIATVYVVFFWAFVWANVDISTMEARDSLTAYWLTELVWVLPVHVVFGGLASLKSRWWLLVCFANSVTLVYVIVRWVWL